MTIKRYYSIFLFCIGCAFFFATCDTVNNLDPDYKNYFVRYFGEEGDQQGVDLIINETDNSLILLGTTTNGQTSRLFLVKSDWNGNVIWKRTLGGPSDVAKDIETANDGGYIILAETLGLGNDADVKLLKISSAGDKIDSVVYGSPLKDGRYANEFPVSVTALGDGYIVTGSTDIDTTRAGLGLPNFSDIMHLRFDEALNRDVGFITYSSNSTIEYGVRAEPVSSGGIFLFGSSFTSSSSSDASLTDFNFWFFDVNQLGLPQGHGGAFGNDDAGNDEILKAICPALTPGYFLVGTYTNTASLNTRDMYVARVTQDTETNGDIIYRKVQGDRRIVITGSSGNRKIEPVAVCQSSVGRQGYIILGNEGESNARNIWISKVDDLGIELLWSASFGALGGNDDTAGMVGELPDGSIVVVGTVNLGDENILKMALFKLSREGRFAR